MPTDELFEKYSRKTIGERKKQSYDEFIQKVDKTESNTFNKSLNKTIPVETLRVSSGLDVYTGPWTEREAIHLLKRTNFGNRKAGVDLLLSKGSASTAVNWVTNLINHTTPQKPSPGPLNFYQNLPNATDSTTAYGEDWSMNNLEYALPTNQGGTDNIVNNNRVLSLQCWHWGIWLNDDKYKIREKMVNFWYHFIPVEFNEVRLLTPQSGTICSGYMKIFRENALGNFRTIIELVTKSSAMIFYLGNHYSTADAPNENYARELMELFAIGKDPQNYTEQDVQAAAKILSGWRQQNNVKNHPYPVTTSFNKNRHNQENKTFSSFFNNTTILNKTGQNGAQELDEFFDMLFQYQGQAIAKYICRRLYRYFVYYVIDAETESTIITPLANQLINSNWEIKNVVNRLLKSQHFFDMANRGVMIKSPFDFIAGMLNTFNVNTTAATEGDIFRQYRIWENYYNYAKNSLEQDFGNVPTVSGWKAYYQPPTFYQNWINSSTIQKRDLLIDELIAGNRTIQGIKPKIDGISFLKQFDTSIQDDPSAVVDVFILYCLPMDLPQTYKEEIKIQTLLSNQSTDNYWTSAWQTYLSNPNTVNTKTVDDKLKALLNAILKLSEFQLM
ncbi:DUF1800 domain-containing protein [Pseudopedobacter beijingensis]|uniref:DUF1800 family protein n=1 Tax=Pseudopedobacter beijingensis TaxID=1207056 RepID=A0ABW4IDS2_9SPHI